MEALYFRTDPVPEDYVCRELEAARYCASLQAGMKQAVSPQDQRLLRLNDFPRLFSLPNEMKPFASFRYFALLLFVPYLLRTLLAAPGIMRVHAKSQARLNAG